MVLFPARVLRISGVPGRTDPALSSARSSSTPHLSAGDSRFRAPKGPARGYRADASPRSERQDSSESGARCFLCRRRQRGEPAGHRRGARTKMGILEVTAAQRSQQQPGGHNAAGSRFKEHSRRQFGCARPLFQQGFFDCLRPQGSPLCEYEQTRDSVRLGREGSPRRKWEDRSCGKRACPRRNRRNPSINFECFLNSAYSGCAFGDA